MGNWRYYAQRAVSKEWLDTNAQLAEVDLTWSLSAPNSAQAQIPSGLTNSVAADGQLTWGKWNTLLYAEEDGVLSWVGVCSAAWPDGSDLKLEFVGISGWLQRVPFMGEIATWKVNAFTIVRELITSAINYAKPYQLDIIASSGMSAYTLGDTRPPAKPTAPARKKGETLVHWQTSAAYKAYSAALAAWNTTYANYKPYTLGWWEGQYIGEEIDSLAKELDFEYRERYAWADRTALTSHFYLDFADDMVRRRDDIAFVDGTNLAQQIAPKDGDKVYANRVIALGAGEGRSMVRVGVGGNDGRLYQAQFVNYKAVRDVNRLRALAQADWTMLSNKEYDIDQVVVWDVPGYASISTLATGDEVKVQSSGTEPPIDTWRRITQIQRRPEESTATLTLEYAS